MKRWHLSGREVRPISLIDSMTKGRKIIQRGERADKSRVVLDGDVAERDARIISSLVSLNCSEIGEVEGDWKDIDNERAALDAAFLGSKRDGFGGSMVY